MMLILVNNFAINNFTTTLLTYFNNDASCNGAYFIIRVCIFFNKTLYVLTPVKKVYLISKEMH